MHCRPVARAGCFAGSASLAAHAPAQAQQQPSANAIALAKEIIVVKGARKHVRPGRSPSVIEQAKQAVPADQSDARARTSTRSRRKLRTEFAPRSAELVDEVAKLYAARFTEQELKDVLAFYKSPVGKKMIARGAGDPRSEREQSRTPGRASSPRRCIGKIPRRDEEEGARALSRLRRVARRRRATHG